MSLRRCPHCGYALADGQAVCGQCNRSTEPPPPIPAGPINAVLTRYADAYQVAAGQVGLGDTLKKVGIGLGIALALVALSAAADRYGGGSIAFFGLLGAGAVGGVVWSWGNSLAAQGQVLRATLDTAVSASPFLNGPEKAQAMGLPPSVVRQ